MILKLFWIIFNLRKVNILITGSNGLYGRNLKNKLMKLNYSNIYEFNSSSSIENIPNIKFDYLFHFAAIHRTQNPSDFELVNVKLLQNIVNKIMNKKLTIIYSSSIQALEDIPYGQSKKKAEEFLIKQKSNNEIKKLFIYRLTNTFGPFARPGGHSVVSNFCFNVKKDLPIELKDPNRILRLQYIDDVLTKIFKDVFFWRIVKNSNYYIIPKKYIYEISVQDLALLIKSFKNHPIIRNDFEKKLYNTYKSY
jgi:UDP-2-acetamido-2,6-beta-L-arabino-hexul-4-ose reductase